MRVISHIEGQRRRQTEGRQGFLFDLSFQFAAILFRFSAGGILVAAGAENMISRACSTVHVHSATLPLCAFSLI